MFLVNQIYSYHISGTQDGIWAEIKINWPKACYFNFEKSSILFFEKGFVLEEMLTHENKEIRQFALSCLEQAKAYIEKNKT